MDSLIDFLLLKDPNVRWVVLGVVLMAASSAVVGVFAFLRKRGLVGDAVSHSILPGICLAFMLTGVKNPLGLMTGAFLSGWFSIWVIGIITRQSRIKSDAAIALVLSVFYGFGILLLTIIQQSGNASQAGLDKFLFGKAASLVYEDVMIFSGFALALLLLVYLFFNAFRLVIFDKDFAQARGFPVYWIEVLLSSLTVLAITIGIQTVGVVLMVALLISPAATARYWTHNLTSMTLLAALFGGLSGLLGAYVSYEWPRMPTGPWVVSFLSIFALVSVFLGRRKGIWFQWQQRRQNQAKMREENVLKCLYHLGEKHQDAERIYTQEEILSHRYFSASDLKKSLRRLVKNGYVQLENDQVRLLEPGLEEGKRVTRIHRLWELYLTRRLQLAADHVHEDAEAIEHIITPELEEALGQELGYPLLDPHESPIPYSQVKKS